jgi:hypothetical protein
MFWFDRENPDVVYGDIRRSNQTLCDGRTLRVEPDIVLDFTQLPFEANRFNIVVFDPPHLLTAGPKSWMAAKYGKLSPTWQEDLRKGFSECFRVLASNGTLIFKWSETQIKIREILELCDVPPLFGHPTGRKGLTHWIVFIKPMENFN